MPFSAQFGDEFPHVCRNRAGEVQPFATDRVDESQLRGVKRLALEGQPGKQRAKAGWRASIDWIAQ